MTTATPDTTTFEDVVGDIDPLAHFVCPKCHPEPYTGVLDANGVHCKGICDWPLTNGRPVGLEDHTLCQTCQEVWLLHVIGHGNDES